MSLNKFQPGEEKKIFCFPGLTFSLHRLKRALLSGSNRELLQSNVGGSDDRMVIECSLLQPENISSPSMYSLPGSFAFCRDVHSAMIYDSSSVIESGNDMSVIDEQNENAFEPMCSIFSGSDILLSSEQ